MSGKGRNIDSDFEATRSQCGRDSSAEQDRGCQETAGMPNIKIPLYDSAAGSGRVVGTPPHGPESARKSDDDLLSNAKIINIRYARKEAKTKTTNSSSMGA